MLDNSKIFGFSMNQCVNLIGILFLVILFFGKNPASKWDRSISGDGKSYYAYLTAAVIYQDLDYQFVEDYEAKYYPPDQSLFKEFRQDFNGEIANKTFPGISLLWLPFFLLAHLLSYLFGFEPDGYSLLYQLSISISAIFYFWLGLKWLSKLLSSLGYANKYILPTLILLAFGTNLYFYTIHDPSLTHCYNFTLLAGILHFSRRFYIEHHSKLLFIAIALFALAIITRPTNILMIIFLPLAIGNWTNFKSFIGSIFRNKKRILGAFAVLIVIGSYPVLWWFAQTGHLIVYSYGKEGFDFSNPHIFNILFSYEKGWLLYTPAILLSTLGLFYFYTKNKFQFALAIIGFAILAYVFSSWWIWTYGASFGQRVFVDFYAVIAILFISGLTQLSQSKFAVSVWFMLACSFVGLNQLQTYQFKNGILPSIGATKVTYWNSYFKLKKVRKSYPVSKMYDTINQYKTDFEFDVDWLTIKLTTDSRAQSGKFSQLVESKSPYSGGYKGRIPLDADFVQIAVSIYCESNSASPQLIYELASNANNSIYNSKALLPFLEKNKWTQFYFTIELNDK
ncbi:MAG: hypothetical protein AB8B72_01280, partial [Crocinitomicaceae bacterium]